MSKAETVTWECPTCGREFSSERGMKVHHKRVHDESIAGREIECGTCGGMFSKTRCLIEEHEHHFCSKSCRLEWKRNDRQTLLDELRRLEEKLDRTPSQTHLKEYSEYNKKSYKRAFGGWNEALREAGMEPNRENYTRDGCIADILTVAGEIGHPPQMTEHDNHGRISATCIRSKFGSWADAITAAGLDATTVGEYNIPREDFLTAIRTVREEIGKTPTKDEMDELGAYASVTIQKEFDTWNDALRQAGCEPNVKPPLTIECTYCGESEKKYRHNVKRAENNFCSQECHWEWLREGNAPVGEEHHQYKPDTSSPEYGSGWLSQRRKARKRDEYTCQRCGIDEVEHKKIYDCELHVHHITPWHEFDDSQERNELRNLVTLCASCHGKIERLPVRPEFEMN